MTDPTGRVVVTYNGEIYNDTELRANLSRNFGTAFRTSCDTEIIPAGYLAWGEEFFERIEGMFAIALWDRQTSKMILARDGVGIKPLFYSVDESTLRFGSEIKAILADSNQPRNLSAEGIHRFLALGYSGPSTTTFDSIRQVPPGSIITFSNQGYSDRRFWQPTRRPDIFNLNDAVDGFLDLWPKVVEDQMVSDVPLGILQSGGIDSTLVSFAANRAPTRTPLFTARFAEQSFNETSQAEGVARCLGASFTSVPVDSSTTAEILRQVVFHYDGQIADEASVPLYSLAKSVREHVSVAMCGDGGDEFFGGYSTFFASKIARVFGPFLPLSAWSFLGQLAQRRGGRDETRLPLTVKVKRLALGIADGGPMYSHAYWRRLVPRFLLRDLYGQKLLPLLDQDPISEYRDHLASAGGSLIDRALVADQRFHLPACLLLKSDLMTMAHGLELRVPLLDRRIMDFAGRIDQTALIGKAGKGKLVLRDAARRLGAPNFVVNAPKRGFNSPIARLLRTDLRALSNACFDAEVDRLVPWLQPSAVRRLWREHRDGSANHDYTLWPILNLSLHLELIEAPNKENLG